MFVKASVFEVYTLAFFLEQVPETFQAGNPYLRGRLSTFDLLVLTSLVRLLLILKTLFTLLQNKLP